MAVWKLRFGAPDCVAGAASIAFPAGSAVAADGVQCFQPGRARGTLRRVEAEHVRVTRSVVLPLREIELRASRSSGPGGQHAQKSSTRIEASFDVEASSALTDAQKRRVVGRVGPVLRAVAQDERSQLRNRELATDRLVEKLCAALAVPRKRVPTKRSAAANRRRLESKRRRARTKTLRKPPAE